MVLMIFFSVLGFLWELYLEVVDLVERIKVLCKELENLDEEIVIGGFNII